MIRYYLLAAFIIGVDQLTKWIIVKEMELYEQITVINDFFYITSHRNTGAAWGILEGQMWFFYIVTLIVVVGIIYYLHKYTLDQPLLRIALSLILGGAIGNLIDRVFRKEVVDFFDFLIFNYNYPIFNVADSALVVGVAFVIIATFVEEKKKGQTPS
ncbi:Signal peptidase II [Lentibacillus sp. JNUCC-1]|uniref:signal peptidase II n=1 Tax=Lentibacillus sp. JNUCC-1 TaxID=2654513 RepID=UPI0012E93F05|nr:signal peptidase II [Lentibacillus sp. JNUCC-1]MUV36204.1 Signal peptidase II [Lentibacillus sp. JNUCC-1]